MIEMLTLVFVFLILQPSLVPCWPIFPSNRVRASTGQPGLITNTKHGDDFRSRTAQHLVLHQPKKMVLHHRVCVYQMTLDKYTMYKKK